MIMTLLNILVMNHQMTVNILLHLESYVEKWEYINNDIKSIFEIG